MGSNRVVCLDFFCVGNSFIVVVDVVGVVFKYFEWDMWLVLVVVWLVGLVKCWCLSFYVGRYLFIKKVWEFDDGYERRDEVWWKGKDV